MMMMMVMIKYQNLWMIYFFFPIWFPGSNRTWIGPCFLVEKHTEIESSFIWAWLSTLFPGCAGSWPTFRFLIKVWSTYHPLICFTNQYWALGSYHWLELRFELAGLGLDLNPMLQPSLWESCWDFWTHVQLIINQHLISHLALFLELQQPLGPHREERWLNQGQSRHSPRHYTEPEALNVFVGQPVDPSEKFKDNLGNKGRCQSLQKVWIRLVSTIMGCDQRCFIDYR